MMELYPAHFHTSRKITIAFQYFGSAYQRTGSAPRAISARFATPFAPVTISSPVFLSTRKFEVRNPYRIAPTTTQLRKYGKNIALWLTFLNSPFLTSFIAIAIVIGTAVPRISPQKLMISVFLTAFQKYGFPLRK